MVRTVKDMVVGEEKRRGGADPATLGVVTNDCHGRRMVRVGEPRHAIQSQGSDFRGSQEREAHRKQVRERHSESWLMEGAQDTSTVGKGPVGPPVPGAESVWEVGPSGGCEGECVQGLSPPLWFEDP